MKNKKILFSIFLLLCLTIFSLSGCLFNKTVETTVTFMVDGEVYDTMKIDGKNVDELVEPAPEKEDFVFNGWFKNQSFSVKFNLKSYAKENNREDITVYASFAEPYVHKKTVEFDVNGGDEEIAPIEHEVGVTLDLPTPVRAGYTFEGWYRYGTDDFYGGTGRMPNQNLLLVARWKKVEAVFEDEFVKLKPAKVGKKQQDRFYGQYGGLGIDEYLYAELTSDDLDSMFQFGHSAKFDLSSDGRLDYKVKDGGYALTWYFYSFDTLNDALESNVHYGSNIQLLTVSQGQNVLKRYLVDIYILQDYTVNLYTDFYAETPYQTLRIIEGERLSAKTPAYEIEGYEFDERVYPDGDSGNYLPFDYDTVIKQDYDLYQTYKAVELKAEAVDGMVLNEKIEIKPYTQNLQLPVPSKSGYDFMGWRVSEKRVYFADFEGKTNSNYIGKTTGDNLTTLYPEFKAKLYYREFDPDTKVLSVYPATPRVSYTTAAHREILLMSYVYYKDAEVTYLDLDPQDVVKFGALLPTFFKPNKAGYFAALYDESGAAFDGASWIYPDGQRLTVVYTAEARTITFDSLGGSEVAPITQLADSDLSLPVPTRENYRFVAWATRGNYTETQVFWDKMPGNNVTLYAVWMRQYKVTFVAGNGSETIIKAFDEKTLIDNPEVAPIGDSFVINWYGDEAFTNVWMFGNSNYKLTEDTTLYAKWGSLTVTDNTVTGTSEKSYLKELAITIPDGVTAIGDNAFMFCEAITSISIPNGVTGIGSHAFYACRGLTEITLPNSVTTIGENAFKSCQGVTEITVPDGVTAIGDGAFSYCAGLEKVTVPDSVTDLGNDVFYYCNNITEATVPASAIVSLPKTRLQTVVVTGGTVIPSSAFFNCNELISVTLPEGITEICYKAFANCGKLTAITLPDSVTTIGVWAFRESSSLADINFSPSVTDIGEDAFEGTAWYDNIQDGAVYIGKVLHHYKGSMPEGTRITVADGTESIAPKAFYNKSGLAAVTIPDSVTAIGDQAFYYCTGLTEITLGSGLKVIGVSAFSNCTGLTEITLPEGVTTIGSMAFADCGKLTEFTVPGSVTKTGTSVFYGCSSLASVEIGSGVDAVEDGTFRNCVALTGITLPGKITRIGSEAFYGCTGLTALNIPERVTEIGASAFYNCTELADVNIPDGVTVIGSGTFYGCGKLTGITIPDGVAKIGASAFSYCSGLTSITIPDDVTEIGASAFSGCTGLTDITVPDRVESIGASAFYGCDALRSLTVGDGVTVIGASAFYGCGSLVTLSIGNGVLSIGNNAFRDCVALTEVTLPDGVTEMGASAFENCIELGSINIPDGVTVISDKTFYGCKLLRSLTIPDNVTEIGSQAFCGCKFLSNLYGGANVERVGARAFEDSAWFKNRSENIVYFGKVLYVYKGSATASLQLTVRDGTVSVAEEAFKNCSGLTGITVPDSLTHIGEDAFTGTAWYNGQPDGKVMLGKILYKFKGALVEDEFNKGNLSVGNVVSIADGAFIGSSGLKKEVNVYSCGTIGERAFYNCTEIKSLRIENVTNIGNSAFSGCSGLTNLYLGSNIKSIGEEAFRGCTALKKVTLSDRVTEIVKYAFRNCIGLTEITIGRNVTSIGDYVFDGCRYLNNITYKGTKEQWKAIEKTVNWKYGAGSFTVTCTDGTLDMVAA